MNQDLEDTIAAVSTAPGTAAVGVIRVSGPRSMELLGRLVPSAAAPEPRRVSVGWVLDPGTGERADKVLYCFMKAPASYTGEDMVELQGHGGARNMEKLMSCVMAAGARPARRGEFTMRAFLHGKLDLVRAEAVLSVVSARSERGLQAARNQLAGVLSEEVESLRRLMLSQLARIESSMDFPEDAGETELEEDVLDEIERRLDSLLGKWNRSRTLVEGLKVVITGRTNAGKSSLLNRIVGRKRAIVDALPGTTRDYIEAAVELRGHHVTLVDTAGIRETGDRVEILGMQAAKEALGEADVVLLLVDDTGLDSWEIEAAGKESRGALLVPALNKADLGWSAPPDLMKALSPFRPLRISCLTGEGIDELEDRLVEIAGGGLDLGEPVLTSARHFACISESRESLGTMRRLMREKHADDLVASCLRGAVTALDEMTGREVVSDLLDEIFSRFCIGK